MKPTLSRFYLNPQSGSESETTTAPPPGSSSKPAIQRRFARLSWLAVFVVLLLATQGCRNYRSQRAYDRGVEAIRTQDCDLAIAEFSTVIRLKPKHAGAYNDRGLAYAQKGDWDPALADFNEAIRLNPDYVEALSNRAHSYDRKGDHDHAIADYTEAIRLRPKFVLAYNGRGRAYAHQRDWDKAIAAFTESIRLNPDDPTVYYNRGLAYEDKADYVKALADYNEAIRLKPDYAAACNSLAWLLAVCPDAGIRTGEKAVEYAIRACDLSEWKDASMLRPLAAACAETGDFDNAVKWETKCLESNPSPGASNEPRQRLSLYQRNKPYHENSP
jgi:tetratricopeptide (TPR) repeat protein